MDKKIEILKYLYGSIQYVVAENVALLWNGVPALMMSVWQLGENPLVNYDARTAVFRSKPLLISLENAISAAIQECYLINITYLSLASMGYCQEENEKQETKKCRWAEGHCQRNLGFTPPQQCHKLITSMPRRIEAVIKAKEAPTKYWVHIQ